MGRYRALGTVTLAQGARVGLSAEQAGARAHALREVGRGVYEATAPVQFKAGEEFGHDSDLPKALALVAEESGARRARRTPDSRPPPEPFPCPEPAVDQTAGAADA